MPRAKPPDCARCLREKAIAGSSSAFAATNKRFARKNASSARATPTARGIRASQPPELWDYYPYDIPDGAHVRIHPLLHWTELDIWRYTLRENIPYVPLYLAKNGKRYRSLGESNITFPIDSDADTVEKIIAELEVTRQPERAGRAMDSETEDAFERLRTSGYM